MAAPVQAPIRLAAKVLYLDKGVHRRNQRNADDGKYHQRKVLLDNRDVAKKVTRIGKQAHPKHVSDKAKAEKADVLHVANSRHKRRKGADNGHKAGNNKGDAPVLLVKRVGFIDIAALDELVVLVVNPIANKVANPVVGVVAQHGRAQERWHQQVYVYRVALHGRDGSGGKQQRVAGQEWRYHQARFAENNGEKDQVGPRLVVGNDLEQVFVDMQDKIDELLNKVEHVK